MKKGISRRINEHRSRKHTYKQPKLKCWNCRRQIDTSGPIGFCSSCGGPLCANCSTMNRMEVEDSKTSSFPFIIISKTTEIKTTVTTCKICKDRIEKQTSSGVTKSIITGLAVFGGLFIVIFLSSGGEHGELFFSFCTSCGLGIGAFLLIMFFAVSLKEKKLGPFCPTCGRHLMKHLLMLAKHMGKETPGIPNHLDCPYCGYKGPIAPMEGLSLYVIKYGARSLAYTSVAQIAKYSEKVLRGKR